MVGRASAHAVDAVVINGDFAHTVPRLVPEAAPAALARPEARPRRGSPARPSCSISASRARSGRCRTTRSSWRATTSGTSARSRPASCPRSPRSTSSTRAPPTSRMAPTGPHQPLRAGAGAEPARRHRLAPAPHLATARLVLERLALLGPARDRAPHPLRARRDTAGLAGRVRGRRGCHLQPRARSAADALLPPAQPVRTRSLPRRRRHPPGQRPAGDLRGCADHDPAAARGPGPGPKRLPPCTWSACRSRPEWTKRREGASAAPDARLLAAPACGGDAGRPRRGHRAAPRASSGSRSATGASTRRAARSAVSGAPTAAVEEFAFEDLAPGRLRRRELPRPQRQRPRSTPSRPACRREPYGFSNDVGRLGPPSFERALVADRRGQDHHRRPGAAIAGRR